MSKISVLIPLHALAQWLLCKIILTVLIFLKQNLLIINSDFREKQLINVVIHKNEKGQHFNTPPCIGAMTFMQKYLNCFNIFETKPTNNQLRL